MSEASNYPVTCIKKRRTLGQLDHRDSSEVNVGKVDHNILDMSWQSDGLVGQGES